MLNYIMNKIVIYLVSKHIFKLILFLDTSKVIIIFVFECHAVTYTANSFTTLFVYKFNWFLFILNLKNTSWYLELSIRKYDLYEKAEIILTHG